MPKIYTEIITEEIANSIEEFKEIYKKYHGKDAEYTINGRFLLLKDSKCTIILDKLYQLTDFYKFRLKSNLTVNDKFTLNDYDYFDNLLSTKSITYHVPSIVFQVSETTFGYAWRMEKNCKSAHERVDNPLGDRWGAKKIEYNGLLQSIGKWSKQIGISKVCFRKRLSTYGLCDLIFMSKEEFGINRVHYKKLQCSSTKIQNVEYGTPEWNSYSDKRPKKPYNGSYIYRELDLSPEDITQRSAELLVEALILDAKQDILYNTEDRDEAEKFLCNHYNCMVFLLSEFSHVEISSALRALRKYCEKYPKSTPKKRKCSRNFNK